MDKANCPGRKNVELTLGSDGEDPSDEMLQTVKSWIEAWPVHAPKIIEYFRCKLHGCSGKPNMPVPEKFEVESINILWKDKPKTCMIYFHYPGDEYRLWHVTFERFEPRGLAYDD